MERTSSLGSKYFGVSWSVFVLSLPVPRATDKTSDSAHFFFIFSLSTVLIRLLGGGKEPANTRSSPALVPLNNVGLPVRIRQQHPPRTQRL